MRERKKTAVHGTLRMTYMAVEFNFQQVLLKTLNSRINIIETRAILRSENIHIEANSGFLKSCVFQKVLEPIFRLFC